LLVSTKKQLGKVAPALLRRLMAKGYLDAQRRDDGSYRWPRGEWLKDQWFKTWPEMPRYFARVDAQAAGSESGRAMVETLFTQRFRGDATYCARCNNGFQALGADCAKNAGWLIARSQYVTQADLAAALAVVDPLRSHPALSGTNFDAQAWAAVDLAGALRPGETNSTHGSGYSFGSLQYIDQKHAALFGSRTVAMVHDEYIIEVNDDEHAHDAAYALAEAMRSGANAFLRDVPIAASKMKPLLMRRWSKKAKPVFDENKRLFTWEAQTQAA